MNSSLYTVPEEKKDSNNLKLQQNCSLVLIKNRTLRLNRKQNDFDLNELDIFLVVQSNKEDKEDKQQWQERDRNRYDHTAATIPVPQVRGCRKDTALYGGKAHNSGCGGSDTEQWTCRSDIAELNYTNKKSTCASPFSLRHVSRPGSHYQTLITQKTADGYEYEKAMLQRQSPLGIRGRLAVFLATCLSGLNKLTTLAINSHQVSLSQR